MHIYNPETKKANENPPSHGRFPKQNTDNRYEIVLSTSQNKFLRTNMTQTGIIQGYDSKTPKSIGP